MSIQYRAITSDEVASFRQKLSMGFGGDAKPEGEARFRSLMPLERTVAAFDDDEVVGTLGDFPMQLTVPGGAQVQMAGTTMVTVQATHTRRGILRSMMRQHMDNAVERGEPVAVLWASEPGIYGRFGFGLAVECHSVKIDARHVTNLTPAADVGLSMLRAEDIPAVVAPFWSEIAHERSGFIERVEARWQDLMNDPEDNRGGATQGRHIIARRAGKVVGYMAYRQQEKWDEFVAEGAVQINALVASDNDAHLALWAYALDVDLFPHVSFWDGAVDDPLAYVLRESREVKKLLADSIYVRILDIEASLTARRYEQDGEIVMKVSDDMGYIGGTYRLTVTDGTAVLTPTTDAADVSLGCRELGALYLGRVCADLYAATGHITGDQAAVRRLGQLFATARAPWCPEMF